MGCDADHGGRDTVNLERYYGLVIDRAGLPEVPPLPRQWAEQLDVPIIPVRDEWARRYCRFSAPRGSMIPSHITANPKHTTRLPTPWGDLIRPKRAAVLYWCEANWTPFEELVLMHELGHVATDSFNPKLAMSTRDSELNAWLWCIDHIGRELTELEEGRMDMALKSYGIYPPDWTLEDVIADTQHTTQGLTALLHCK